MWRIGRWLAKRLVYLRDTDQRLCHLGVLTATVPGDLIDAVLSDTGGRATATVNCRPA